MANKCSLLWACARSREGKRIIIVENACSTQHWYGSQSVKSKQNGSAMAEGGNTRPGTYSLTLSSLPPWQENSSPCTLKTIYLEGLSFYKWGELIGNPLSETAYTMVSCVLPDLSVINRMTFILCIVSLLGITNQLQMWLWNSSRCSNKLWTMDWRWHGSCTLLAICVLNIHMFFTSKYSHIESGWTENPPERCSVKVCT